MLGWSISAGVSLPVGIDAGMAKYRMFTSECFGGHDDEWWGIWKFIGMIWLPHCLRCSGWVETAVFDSLRVAIHKASYPVITDHIHSLLAMKVHKMRKQMKVPQCKQHNGTWATCEDNTYNPNKPERERCSLRSTTFRDDPVRLFEVISQKLHESTVLLDDITDSYDKLLKKIQDAMEVNHDVLSSKEIKDFVKTMKSHNVGCLRAPQETLMSFTSGRFAYKGDAVFNREHLNTLSERDLLALCKKKKYCKKHLVKKVTPKEDLVKKLLKTTHMANEARPFGTCSKDIKCQDAAKGSNYVKRMMGRTSKRTIENMTKMLECYCPHRSWLDCRRQLDAGDCHRKCPGLSGTCACAEGWCYSQQDKSKFCVPDDTSASMMGLKGLRSTLRNWVRAREFEIGNAARHLRTLTGAGEGTEKQSLGILE